MNPLIYALPLLGLAYWWFTGATPKLERGQPSFTLYYLNGCGHCTAMMPEWLSLGNSFEGIAIRRVEASANMEYLTNSFPTIVWRDGFGIEQVYSGERSRGAFVSFMRFVSHNSVS